MCFEGSQQPGTEQGGINNRTENSKAMMAEYSKTMMAEYSKTMVGDYSKTVVAEYRYTVVAEQHDGRWQKTYRRLLIQPTGIIKLCTYIHTHSWFKQAAIGTKTLFRKLRP
jgi:hypothetical protein